MADNQSTQTRPEFTWLFWQPQITLLNAPQ